MRLVFRIVDNYDNLKVFQTLRSKVIDYWKTIEDFPCGASLTQDDENFIRLTHCTGNSWEFRKNSEGIEIEYRGSRAGFHQSPLWDKYAGKFLMKEHSTDGVQGITVYYFAPEEDAFVSLAFFELTYYCTTNPSLKWYERIVPLLDDPSHAVVFWFGTPIRVVPYKNVYGEGEYEVQRVEG